MMLHGIHYRDRYRRFDRLYRITDPWGLNCVREHDRFAKTNTIISREFPHARSILEIGCGEGLQSAYLTKVCESLVGIDVSATAVKRARKQCPQATFLIGSVLTNPSVTSSAPYDLVVACEMLYYVKEVPALLNRISEIGRGCLVTYLDVHRANLGLQLAQIKAARTDVISHGDTAWIATWWPGNHAS